MIKETDNFPLALETYWTHYKNGLETRNLLGFCLRVFVFTALF